MDEIVAVNRETSAIPANIIKTANNLPSGVVGEKSPYPTVVIVTIAHQKGVSFSVIEPVSKYIIINPPIIIIINKPAPTWKKLFRISFLNHRLIDKNLSLE